MKLKKYNKAYEGNYRSREKPSVIPRKFLEEMCYSIGGLKVLGDCPYYITSDCPGTCEYSRKMSQGIIHTARTGLERFKNRYPEYQGVK
jgi:hypothetical protein